MVKMQSAKVLPSNRFLLPQDVCKQNRKWEMVANETGLTDLTLETVWNVYDTLFCEVSGSGLLSQLGRPGGQAK